MSEQSEMEEWAEDVRAKMRAEYDSLPDAVEKMRFLETAAKLLDIQKSQVLLFLRSSGPVNTNPPPERSHPHDG